MSASLAPGIPELLTPRLKLRGWREEDRAPFAAQNADAETMRYLGGPMTREASDAYLDRTLRGWAEDGCGKWAVELAETGQFVGALGLQRYRFEAPFTNPSGIEFAWRLTRAFWGRGFATEAARAALDFGFAQIRGEPPRGDDCAAHLARPAETRLSRHGGDGRQPARLR